MFFEQPKYEKRIIRKYQDFKDLKGYLDDKEAICSLVEFMRTNLTWTVEFLTGIRLYPWQEIVLKGMLNRDYSLLVLGRGLGKSTLAAVFVILKMIFEPGTKIVIAGPTFRTARIIFGNVEKMVESRAGIFLAQCFNIKDRQRRGDGFVWRCNGGELYAIPLSGEKVRGLRANVLIIDEFLLMPKDTVEKVLMPFMVAPQNQKERQLVRDREDELIAQGLMTEEDRRVFKNESQMIALSSASYTFDYLYEKYKDYIEKIYNPPKDSDATYFVAQMSWDTVPEDAIDKSVVEQGKTGGEENPNFKREYGAQFTDGNDGYFSAVKMKQCTFEVGEFPHTLLKGDPDKEYILSVDPSYSDADDSDETAFSICELDRETGTAVLVHGYAHAESDLIEQSEYLAYILLNFNIVFVITDSSGSDQLFATANDSKHFVENNLRLKFLDFNPSAENKDYAVEIAKAKAQYNKEEGVMVVRQVFGAGDFIRRANERLQNQIIAKKQWFASATYPCDSYRTASLNINLAKEELAGYISNGKGRIDMIDYQDDMIEKTKNQCALIKVDTSHTGKQAFNLPLHLRKIKGKDRPRRDSYTSLFLNSWGQKLYIDIVNYKEKEVQATFTPRAIGWKS